MNSTLVKSVPFLDLITPHLELEEELVDVFRKALRSASFVGGAEVEGFEHEFATYCGSQHCVGVASGTDAVRFALIACGVGAGDTVITVSHTFIATVEAISQAGADTEFVDIDPSTYCMSPQCLAAFLAGCKRDPATGRPIGTRSGKPIKAVVPVHIYGQVADMDAILAIASEYDLLVIEDACQAHGAEYQSADGTWRRAGAIGHAGAFSFYPGKNLGACGEGGAVTTSDSAIAQKARMLRDHGQSTKYFHDIEGYNGRLHAVQAAFLRVKLRRLDDWNSQRSVAAARYDRLLSSIDGLVTPVSDASRKVVYHLYVVRHGARDALAAYLKTKNIATGLHYPTPLHLQQCYRGWGLGVGALPVTERLASEILSLPMFPGISPDQQQHVADSISAFAAGQVKDPVE
jgi:dTDP-4-amino-4,6-dideoxygalactose transaminase